MVKKRSSLTLTSISLCVIAFYLMSISRVGAENSVITFAANGSVAIPQGAFYDVDDNRISISGSSSSEFQFDGVVAKIGSYAFHNCKGLTSITLPNSITSIGYFAFSNCEELTTPVYNSTIFARLPIGYSESYAVPEGTTVIASAAFRNCQNLPSVTIPQSVTTISESAFFNCSSLSSIAIPGNVTTIGDFAFGGCALNSIMVEAETPAAIHETTFKDVDKRNCTLYVPYGCRSAYQAASYWNEFKKIEEIDPGIFAFDNAIYTSLVEGRIGGNKSISVRLKNNFDFNGFHFQMQLPEGVTINDYTLNESRLPSGMTVSEANVEGIINDNIISIDCSLNDGKTFVGNNDEIVSVGISFDENMDEGNYSIDFSNCYLSTNSKAPNTLETVECNLTLENYEIGDVDGDGRIGISDVISALSYIVNEQTPEDFNPKAADADEDGQLRINDVMLILNTIVNQ